MNEELLEDTTKRTQVVHAFARINTLPIEEIDANASPQDLVTRAMAVVDKYLP